MRAAAAQRRQSLAGFEKNATRIAVALVLAGPVLGVAAAGLGAAEVYPYDYAMTVALVAMLVPIGLALLLGACGGLYLMAGLRAAPLGIIFVAGYAGLVYGLVVGDNLWSYLGIGLLGISGGVFYAIGLATRESSPTVIMTWSHPLVLAGGAVVAGVGHLTGIWGLVLAGAMAVGCGLGGIVGHWWAGRGRSGGSAEAATG